jgi:hypothetical protein
MSNLAPNFLVIGAAKCGTSAMYAILDEHPDIFMSPIKEPHYFAFAGMDNPGLEAPDGRPLTINEKAVTNKNKYLKLYSKAEGATARGECSVSTMFFADRSIPAIKEFNPDMKIIAILRNPVDRAYSSFNHARRWGIEREVDFMKAMEVEDKSSTDAYPLLLRYKALSYYSKQLIPFYEEFGKSNIHVVIYDDYKDNPGKVIEAIFSFLGVDSGFKPTLSTERNVSVVPDENRALHRLLVNRGPIKKLIHWLLPWQMRRGIAYKIKRKLFKKPDKLSPEYREKLTALFKDEINELEELLSIDLSFWKATDK